MDKKIPKVGFKKDQTLDIEVLSFAELIEKLDQTSDHDPYAVHKIEFYLIIYISKNVYHHFVDFDLYELSEGSALFIAKNQIHHFTKELLDSEGFIIIFNNIFLTNPSFLTDSLKFNRLFNYHIESPVIHQKDLGTDNFNSMILKLYQEYKFPSNIIKSEILRSLLHIILLQAERAKDKHSIQGVNTQWLEIFNSFKDLLEREYINTRSSRYYASQLLISYKYLNEVVKKLTQKTVKAFIDDFVIMEIKRFLVSTSLSIKEISYATGFEEPANMVKFFKKNTSITPLKFRQQI